MRTFVLAYVFSAALLACSSSNNTGPVCGDGLVEGAEQCDDGDTNGMPGDSCSAACTTIAAPVCGDGHLDVNEQCDDGTANGTVGDHCSATCKNLAYITAMWSVTCVTGDTGCTAGCPVGYDTAQVVSQQVDATGQPIGSPIIDKFDCAAGTGKTDALPPGTYQEYVEITSTDGTAMFAQSLLSDVDTTTADGSFMTNIYIDGGYFHFTWKLVGATTANQLTCAQAMTPTTKITATVSGGTAATSDLFTCSDGQGTTAEIVAGNYTVSVSANNSSMMAVGTADPQTNKVIMDRNTVTELGTIQINIPGM